MPSVRAAERVRLRIWAPELVADLPGLTRVYGSPEHGGIAFSAEGDGPAILKEYRGLLTCREALAGAGIKLTGNQ